MRVYYDFEFYENGQVIVPLSLGMSRQDGEELYVIFKDGLARAAERIRKHEWLMTNVIQHLPIALAEEELCWNELHPDFQHVMPAREATQEIEQFLMDANGTDGLQLWADYCAYDHVSLAQLWGPMMNLPEFIPMWTHDLQQETELHDDIISMRKNITGILKAAFGSSIREHRAIDDARAARVTGEYLIGRRLG